MPRRVSLPGADELFRTTGGAALQAPQPRQHPGGPGGPAGDAREGRDGRDGQNGTPADGRLRPVPAERDGRHEPAERSEDADTGQDAADRADGEGGSEARTGTVSGTGQGAGSGAGPSGGPGDESAEHGGRDIPTSRRPLNSAERGGTPSVTMTVPAPQSQAAPVQPPITAQPQSQQPRRKAPRQNRRPSGRERHDEKITVYVSAEELMDLEHARLVLRGEHGLAIDRGRIVREAVAVVLADLESRGDASILVRRLRGR
ncbi:hypothetical protein [Actinacidiphila alni]|uniref:hypothetical protein n=1 Tax=Actinacidiphila alni TaxID=380248 RepID=UPI003F4CAEF3